MARDVDDFRVIREAAAYEYPFSLIARIWDELATPYKRDGRLARLTPGQRALYALHWIRAEVSNGGFHQCFANSTGYLMPEAMQGAVLLDAGDWASVLDDAANVLRDPFPRRRGARKRLLAALDDRSHGLLDACDDRFFALDQDPQTSLDTVFDRYVIGHPDEFFVENPDDAAVAAALVDTAQKAISSRWNRDLNLAERLLRDALDSAAAADDDTTARHARSLLAQIPHM